jgi:methyl-accepting chemotaxis protein
MGRQKRRTYLVDRAFQYRFIGMFLLSIMISLLLFTGGTVFYYWASSMAGDNLFHEFIDINKQVYEVREDASGNKIRVSTTKTVHGVKRWELVVPPILINNLFMLIVVSVLGILYSHRIAGPVYRINRELGRALDGEAGVRITLRKRDKLRDVATRVNTLLTEFDAVRETMKSVSKNSHSEGYDDE